MSSRKPPPILSPPTAPSTLPRMTSPTYQGGPLAWGARRQSTLELNDGLGISPQPTGGGYPMPSVREYEPMQYLAPTPRLSNFEAAVAALNGTAPPADPNYPSPLQFHQAPSYVAPAPCRQQLAPQPNRPSVGPASAASMAGELPRAPSFYERTMNFLLGSNSAYSVPEQQNSSHGNDLPLPGSTSRGRRSTSRVFSGSRRQRSRSPSPTLEDRLHPYGTPQRAGLSRGPSEKGYGQYDYGHGDMGDTKMYDDALDEEKADMSLDYIDPHEGRYGDEYGDEHYDGRDREGLLHEAPTQHFGLPPEGRVTRRHKTKKRVVLTAGNLVLDLNIPTRLESFLPVKGEPEMMKTRYTAITCDPDNFSEEHFSLRQNAMGRETELAIVITMYNEDEELFCRTLYGVMKNIAHLQGRKNSSTWGPGSWKKIVVCIVSDGRKHINPRVLDCLASLGVFQEGAMKNSVQDKPVQAHMFEYTTSFALDPNLRFKYPDKGIAPTQILFCLKEKNAKKINSHRWFFNAFAKTLDPKVCILLDVGTRPGPKALYHLWKAFDKQSKVGGACGEIATYKGRNWRGLLNPLIASQCFEYKMSNILDKPTESVFGYCSVLPGAFSAYRWLALQNDKDGKGPLASYFMGETLAGKDADTFTANMYLAEDRILCWEIVAKPKCNYVLKFVKAAVAETDCPETIHEFISQRRRWLNGSFFAAVYALTHVTQVFRADHSAFRTTLLLIESFYNLVNLVFSWFAVANFYIFFVIVTSSLEDPTFGVPKISYLNAILQYVYLGTLVACFLFSMGNRPAGSKWKYSTAIYIFATLTIYMMVAAVLCAIRAVTNLDNVMFVRMIISVLSTYGVYVISSIIACDPFHIITCFLQYILLQATYINVLNVYAFSNLHDLSWGTKGSDTVATDLGAVSGSGSQVEVELPADQKDVDAAYNDALDNLRIRKPLEKPMGLTASQLEQRQKDYYANFRTNVLLLWSLTNGILASVILSSGSASSTFDGTSSRTSVYMLCILIFVAATSAFRFLGSTLYLILRLFGA